MPGKGYTRQMRSEHVILVLHPAPAGIAFQSTGTSVLTTLSIGLSLGLLRR